MKQAVFALLFALLLVAFGSPAQACEHMATAEAASATTAQLPAPESAPAAPEHCPPGGAAKLHACCALVLVPVPQASVAALAWQPALFAPLGVNEPRPAPRAALDKPPKFRA